ncbi:MAG: helix-turn-helix transcriptional regulator [Gemmatimonadota bacterium]|nr:helix-turn-helix transcriptional regulator [Gemmatimonadota bacterium]
MNNRSLWDEPDFEVLSESALAQAQAVIQNAMDQTSTSRADLARGMNRSRSFVSRFLSGSHNLTIKTMARAALVCGYEIKFGLAPLHQSRFIDEPQHDDSQVDLGGVPTEGSPRFAFASCCI